MLISALAHLPEAQALFMASERAGESELSEWTLDAGKWWSIEEYTKKFGEPNSKKNQKRQHHICIKNGVKGVHVPDVEEISDEEMDGESEESESSLEPSTDAEVSDEEFQDFGPCGPP